MAVLADEIWGNRANITSEDLDEILEKFRNQHDQLPMVRVTNKYLWKNYFLFYFIKFNRFYHLSNSILSPKAGIHNC